MASSIDASTSGAGGVITTADNTGILNLKTAGTNAVTIDASQNVTVAGNTYLATSSGNVGIGTSSPTSQLAVQTTAGSSTGFLKFTDVTYGGDVRFGKNTGISNDAILGTWGANNTLFYTNSSERMRIDTSGRVCINNTTSAGGQPLYVKALTGVGSAGFQVWQNASGAIDWYNASATYVASVIVNASSVAYNTTSDYRLKDDIVPITGALDKVAQLKPVNWKWKLDGSDGQGFIAHELQAVIPDAVSGEKDAIDEEGNPKYQGVDTSFLVATLTAAIQEQQTIINDLKARVTALEAK